MEEYLALGPLDGRYRKVGEKLAPYFSEYALVKNRVKVEVYWLKYFLENIEKDKVSSKDIEKIINIFDNFDDNSFKRIKEIESVTNHDVKAVELYIGEELKKIKLESLISYVHIGCTSEDINNNSYANMMKESLDKVWIPNANDLIKKLEGMADSYKDIPMLAHTHGQPATPTTVGKELMVYVYRLREALEYVKSVKVKGKFNGATGTYAAISVAYPNINFEEISKDFVENYLKLTFNPITTQIESHDYICHILDNIRHFNNVMLGLDLDMWMYISMEYFKQVAIKTEVGSSTMPHKVNPIKFENSEANVEMSNAILTSLSNKLSKSRMQRDLSDSSSLRNIGLGLGYSVQAITQTIEGLNRVEVNTEKINSELENKWEVLAEPIQTVLRKYNIPDAYDQLKSLTRGKSINENIIKEFINSLDVLSKEDKETLLNLTPSKYIGRSVKIVEEYL